MADLSLRYLLFGEDRTASSSIKGVGSAASSTGKQVSTGLRGIGSMVGGEVGEMIDRVSAGFDSLGEKSKGMGAKLQVGGAALTGIGAAFSMIGSADKAASEQLGVAISNTGNDFSDFKDQIEATIKKQEDYGNSAVQTQDALRILTQATNDPKKALADMAVVADLAAAKHISLSDAALKVAKVYGGAGKVLKEFGITMTNQKAATTHLASAEKQHEAAIAAVAHAQRTLTDIEKVDATHKKLTIGQQIQLKNAQDSLANAQAKLKTSTVTLHTAQDAATKATHSADDAVSQLAKKVKGEASASVDTFAGKLKILTTKAGDAAAVFGQKYGPAIMIAGVATSLFGTIMQIMAARQAAAALATDAAGVAVVRQSMATKIATAAQWLWNVAMDANPIGLVVLAVAALIGVIVLIATKTTWFQTIWQHFTSSIGAAWKFLWNTFIQPYATFMLHTFGTIALAIGGFLSALGNVPGFGWAKTAGALMTGAGNAANNLANNLHKITSPAPISIQLRYTSVADNLTQTLAHSLGSHSVPGRAVGGPVTAGMPYWVGERGPELFVPPSNGMIQPTGSSGSSRGGSSASSSQPLVINQYLDGRLVHQSLLALKRTTGGGLGLETAR